MRNLDSRFQSPATASRLELVLRLEDGSPWRLTVSPGVERFVGRFPMVEGLGADGPLLRFRAAAQA